MSQRLTILISCLFLAMVTSYAQDHLDSLKKELKKVNVEKKIEIYLTISSYYNSINDTEDAIKNAENALSLAQEHKKTADEVRALHQFYKIYLDLDFKKAMDYANKAIELARRTKNEIETFPIYYDISLSYYWEQKYDTAKIYADKATEIARKSKDEAKIMKILSFKQLCELYSGNYNNAIETSNELHAIALKEKSLKHESDAEECLGLTYKAQGEFEKALTHFEKDLQLKQKMGNPSKIALALNNLGTIYMNWGKYKDALEYYHRALKIQEEIKDTLNIARALGNIGNIYYYSGMEMDKALENYNRCLILFDKLGYKEYVGSLYINIGLIYMAKQQPDTALTKFERSLAIAESLNNQSDVATALDNIGTIYLEKGDFNYALENINRAIEIYQQIGEKKSYSQGLANLGIAYFKMGYYSKAIDYFNESIKIGRELNLRKAVSDNYKELYKVYAKQGNYKTALEYFEKHTELKDSVLNEDYYNQITEMQTKYESEQLKAQIEVEKAENARKEEVNKRQRMIIILGLIGVVLILGFLVLVFRQNSVIKRSNILLGQQNEEIRLQRDQIMQQKQEITDSIQYASRIQNAILPPSEYISRYLPHHFILFRPRDIVSGDFYWMNQKNGKTYITVVDCTGHGVPGAFMSMLGTAFLNEIINKEEKITADEILNQLRDHVVESLHQTGDSDEAKDGMDMALCVIDHEANELHFSGAFNPLYLIRNNEITEYKADKMPIGIYLKARDDKFSSETIKLKPNDTFYMFSDGYVDQFGGEKRKKFMSKNFKELLLRIKDENMPKQKEILNTTIEEWMINTEQVDDILVIGFRI